MIRFAALLCLLAACSTAPSTPPPDAGTPPPDAGVTTEDCPTLTAGGSWSVPMFFYDTEARYELGLGTNAVLRLGFARFTDQFTGTFPLGAAGSDGVYGSCAHCVSVEGDGYSLFAEAGTLTIAIDPFQRRLKGSLKGAVLREVVDPASPPAQRMCAKLPDLEFDQAVPDPAWTCAREAWLDGTTCDCECGIFDPDCSDGSHASTCQNGRTCAMGNLPNRSPFDPPTSECLDSCATAPCGEGTCVPWWNFQRNCVKDATRFANVHFGEPCPEPDGRYIFCNVVDGVAQGLCNHDESSATTTACHKICSSTENTCGEHEFCLGAFFDLKKTEIGAEDPFVGSCEPLVP